MWSRLCGTKADLVAPLLPATYDLPGGLFQSGYGMEDLGSRHAPRLAPPNPQQTPLWDEGPGSGDTESYKRFCYIRPQSLTHWQNKTKTKRAAQQGHRMHTHISCCENEPSKQHVSAENRGNFQVDVIFVFIYIIMLFTQTLLFFSS